MKMVLEILNQKIDIEDFANLLKNKFSVKNFILILVFNNGRQTTSGYKQRWRSLTSLLNLIIKRRKNQNLMDMIFLSIFTKECLMNLNKNKVSQKWTY